MSARTDLAEALRGSPYQGYAYAYPHKTAYRPLPQARKLEYVWRNEPKDALFLYLHIPFCEMRCGFCNLFTQSHSRAGMKEELESAYLDALERHAQAQAAALGDAQFARGAIGGGTPTFLTQHGLRRLLKLFTSLSRKSIPLSIETSPFTTTSERLELLKEYGVTRVSIGVQSFIDAEVQASGRAQKLAEVSLALDALRDMDFSELNIDLIYGLPGQTEKSWVASLQTALRWRPEELYLYPLYVRPLTGLASKGARADDDVRRECYRAGRDLLQASGYVQLSMRHFRLAKLKQDTGEYCCQSDGMAGLGCGARSYTRELHYSSEYAVGREGITEIIKDYLARPSSSFESVLFGFELDERELRRRFVIKSILHASGLNTREYEAQFGSAVLDDLPQFGELIENDLVVEQERILKLTALGLEFSDVVGPWLASTEVTQKMSSYIQR